MTHEDLGWILLSAATLLCLAFLLRLRVFQPRSFDHAPPRLGTLTLGSVGAVLLVYCGLQLFSLSLANSAGWLDPLRNPAPLPSQIPHTGPLPAKVFEYLHAAVAAQAIDCFAKLLAAALAVFLVTRRIPNGLHAWGFSLRQLPRGLLLGLIAYLLAIPIVCLSAQAITDLLIHFFHRGMTSHSTLDALQMRPPLLLKSALIVFAALAAPVLEEIFFRGLLQTALLEQGFGLSPRPLPDPLYRPSPAHRWIAITLTSLLFAAVHLDSSHGLYAFTLSLGQGFVLFILSLALSYSYERTGNLYTPITLHALFNTLNILATLTS